jgi:hypothetical protein
MLSEATAVSKRSKTSSSTAPEKRTSKQRTNSKPTSMPTPKVILKIFELDPIRVKANIEKKIGECLIRRLEDQLRLAQGKRPADPNSPFGSEQNIDAYYDKWVKEQKARGDVQVIQYKKNFYLIYDQKFTLGERSLGLGTGPFTSYDEACKWFYGGGR